MILDKESCDVPPPTVVPPSSTDSPSGISPETCEGLKQFANAASNLGTCDTNKQCNTVDCATINGDHMSLVILPCHDPPALHVTVTDSTGGVIYNGIITNRTEIPIGPDIFGVKFVILVHDEPGDMAVEVSL